MKISRRKFLEGSRSCAAIGGISVVSSLIDLGLFARIASAQSNNNDFKVIIYAFADGGMDGQSALVRGDKEGYDAYRAARPMLSFKKEDTIDLKYKDSKGHPIVINKYFGSLGKLINEGKGCIVSNVGITARPVVGAKDPEKTSGIKIKLGDHSANVTQWHTSSVDKLSSNRGVLGRAQSALRSFNSNAKFATAIATSNSRLVLTADGIKPFVMLKDNIQVINKGNSNSNTNSNVTDNIAANMADIRTDNFLENAYAELMGNTITTGETIGKTFDIKDVDGLITGNGDFLQQCKRALKLVYLAKRGDLGGIKRLTIFMKHGGWDTHQKQMGDFPRLATQFSNGIAALYNAIEKIGALNNTVIFTGSEFGRTGREKFDKPEKDSVRTAKTIGTDHAWGNHHFVLGGDVIPGIHGEIPILKAGVGNTTNKFKSRRLTLIPEVSTDQYLATIGKWFGVPNGEMDSIYLNLKNFSKKDVGFLKT